MISLFAVLSLTIKWTRINSSTAWQQGKKHGGAKQHGSIMQTVCSILSEKQTYQELLSVLYLELEITKGSPMHKKEQYFLCTQHASEDWLRYLGKGCGSFAEDDIRSSVTDIFGKVLPILYCGRYHAISVWSRTPVPRHTPRSNERIF